MKKILKRLSMLLVMLLLVSCTACGEGMMAGGWSVTDDAAVTKEASAALSSALEGFAGSAIEPVALLGTQVVAGINYCLLCRVTPVMPNAVSRYAFVYIYQHLDGSAEILDIQDIEISPYRMTEETENEAPMEEMNAELPVMTFLVTCHVEGMEAESGLTIRQEITGDTEVSVFMNLEDGIHEWLMHVPTEAVTETADEYTLAYSNCVHTVTPYNAQGTDDTQIVYTDGTGSITGTDGHYIWTDEKENAGADMDFVADDTLHIITEYHDIVSQRAYMTLYTALSPDDEDRQSATAVISWGDSAFETYEWTMSFEAPIIMEANESFVASYSDCICVRISYTEEGENREIIYENGTGNFTVHTDENGMISYSWLSDNDYIENPCVFYPLYNG